MACRGLGWDTAGTVVDTGGLTRGGGSRLW